MTNKCKITNKDNIQFITEVKNNIVQFYKLRIGKQRNLVAVIRGNNITNNTPLHYLR